MFNVETQNYTTLRNECWDSALDCFGYAYIFTKRAEKYSKLIFWLNLFGIFVPVSVGLTALGYGSDSTILKYCINAAIPLTIIQFLLSLFAILGKWDEKLAYAFESSQARSNLSSQFKKLGQTPPPDEQSLRHAFDLLDTEVDGRTKQDTKQNIKEWELRRGMKASLREFQRSCVECKVIPTSMKSTKCSVCGNYKFKF